MKSSKILKLMLFIGLSFVMIQCEKDVDLSNPGSSEPKEILQKIATLSKDLSARKERIDGTANKLSVELLRVKRTIKTEKKKYSITSAEDAIGNKVIKANLTVMQKISAYLDVISEEKESIFNAEIDLTQMQDQAKIDQIVQEGLQDKEMIREIIAKVDTIIKNVEPNADKPMTPQAEKKKKPIDQLWRENFEKDTDEQELNNQPITTAPEKSVTQTILVPRIPSGLQNTKLTHFESNRICSTLRDEGFDNWRLPTENEFQRITGLPAEYYWTSTQCATGYILVFPSAEKPQKCIPVDSNPPPTYFVVCIREKS